MLFKEMQFYKQIAQQKIAFASNALRGRRKTSGLVMVDREYVGKD